MDKNEFIKLIDLCTGLSEVVAELGEQVENLKSFVKKESSERFALEILLLNKGIVTRDELDELVNEVNDIIESNYIE